MANETRTGGRRRRAALVAMLAAAGGLGWAATSTSTLREALWPDRPGRTAPYTLLKPDRASFEHEIAFYQARIRRDPTGYQDLVALGGVYVRRARATGDAAWYLLAEQCARRSLASFAADNPGAHLLLASVAVARHDFAEGERLLLAVRRRHPREAGVWGGLITIHLARGRLDEAARAAEALLAAAPGTSAYTQRALVRAARGEEAGAIADFTRAIALEQPGELEASTLARAWLGRLHAGHGRLEVAEDLAREALRISPSHPVALGLMGELAARRGRHDEAARRFEAAFGRDASPVHLLDAARAHRAAGRPAEAEALLAEAERLLRRDLADGSFGHRRDLIRLLLERGRPGDLAEALPLAAAERAVRQDAETLGLEAWALSRAGRLDAAAAAIERALALGDRRGEWLERAGRIAEARGRADAARRLFDEAARRDPSRRAAEGATRVAERGD